MMDQLLPVVYMIGVLLLVLPAFLQSNSKLKQFLTNFTIWIIFVVLRPITIGENLNLTSIRRSKQQIN